MSYNNQTQNTNYQRNTQEYTVYYFNNMCGPNLSSKFPYKLNNNKNTLFCMFAYIYAPNCHLIYYILFKLN